MNEITTTQLSPKILEQLLINGDLTSLSTTERLDYYARVCESLGLNPLTKPFAYIKLNGKLVLYGVKNCAEQLRKIHTVSVRNLRAQMMDDEMYVVTADFVDGGGREDQATGVVCLKGLSGEARANKMLTCETKCKNRGTYSIVGLGMLDETEVDSIPGAEKEAAEKFPRLRVAEQPSTEQVALEATMPQAEEPEHVPGRLDRYYGKLRAITLGKTDFDKVNQWVHDRMGKELGLESLADTSDDDLEKIMGWLALAEKTRTQLGKRT